MNDYLRDDHTEPKLSKSQRTKKKIIETYLTLMRRESWDKISVKDLCAAAEITRGTFYQHYDDIYDLMEQIQSDLLARLESAYREIPTKDPVGFEPAEFEEKFDYAPPAYMDCWFLFCQNNRTAMVALIDPKFGDSYFVGKLKAILLKYITRMMNTDGMPNDELRAHFVKIILELHFLSVRSWLSEDTEDHLSRTDILNLLNTMRVGANYLSYRRLVSPDFPIRMALSDDF